MKFQGIFVCSLSFDKSNPVHALWARARTELSYSALPMFINRCMFCCCNCANKHGESCSGGWFYYLYCIQWHRARVHSKCRLPTAVQRGLFRVDPGYHPTFPWVMYPLKEIFSQPGHVFLMILPGNLGTTVSPLMIIISQWVDSYMLSCTMTRSRGKESR
jgi:hypothetical protein